MYLRVMSLICRRVAKSRICRNLHQSQDFACSLKRRPRLAGLTSMRRARFRIADLLKQIPQGRVGERRAFEASRALRLALRFVIVMSFLPDDAADARAPRLRNLSDYGNERSATGSSIRSLHHAVMPKIPGTACRIGRTIALNAPSRTAVNTSNRLEINAETN